MDPPAADDLPDPVATNETDPQGAAADDTAVAASIASLAAVEAANNVDPLVFGELDDDDEKFHTPITGSRASSGNLDTPPAAELAALALGSSSTTAASNTHSTAADVAAAAALASSINQAVNSCSAAAEKDSQQQTADSVLEHGAADEAVNKTPADDIQPPQLSAAAAADEAPTPAAVDSEADSSLQQQPIWSQSSGLVTLSQLAAGHSGGSDSHTSGSDTESESDVQSEGFSREYQQAAAAATGDASSAAAAAQLAAAGSASAAASAATDPSNSSSAFTPSMQETQRQQQQQQADSPHSRSSSPLQRSRLQHVQQQQQRRAFSPPRSPLSPRSPASVLERTASWQLQHAAAAAAGTAAHAAPPRSDLHLTRLGSGAGSPASPRGGAAAAAAAAGSSAGGAAAAADDGWSAWQRRRRHFFVLTAAGKPVFSRHGDEQALAGFMAVIQALVSVVADQGDAIQSISVGSCQLVFLLAGQLYLVAVSSRSEALAALRRQLELLYQSILVVVTGGIEKLLQRSAGYDVQQLLSGAKPSLSALTSAYSNCPGWMFGSVEPAAAAAADRQVAAAALADAVKSGEALYGVLLVGRRVLAAATGKGPPPLNVFDLLLLINFANSNESLRHSETFVPVCLPNFQPNAFLHAYITNIEPDEQQQQQVTSHLQQQRHRHSHDADPSSIFLLLLSGSADSFHKLSAAKQAFVAAMAATAPAAAAAAGSGGAGTVAAAAAGGGVLARAQAAAARLPGGGRLKVEALPAPLGGPVGSTPLWHAVVRFPQRKQHLTLNFPPELFTARSQRKQLVRSYCRLFGAAHAQVLEAAAAAAAAGAQGGGSSSSTNAAGVYGSGVFVPHVTAGGTTGGTPGSTSSSIAGIVGAAGAAASSAAGGMGSGAAAAAAAAAAYMLPYGAMGVPRSHKVVWVSGERWVTGVIVDREVELYVTFDPLTEKDVGLKLGESLRRLFADKTRQQELLVPGL